MEKKRERRRNDIDGIREVERIEKRRMGGGGEEREGVEGKRKG